MISSENAMLWGRVIQRSGPGFRKYCEKRLWSGWKAFPYPPSGYYPEWERQYENLISSQRTLPLILPIVLLVIFGCLYLPFTP